MRWLVGALVVAQPFVVLVGIVLLVLAVRGCV